MLSLVCPVCFRFLVAGVAVSVCSPFLLWGALCPLLSSAPCFCVRSRRWWVGVASAVLRSPSSPVAPVSLAPRCVCSWLVGWVVVSALRGRAWSVARSCSWLLRVSALGVPVSASSSLSSSVVVRVPRSAARAARFLSRAARRLGGVPVCAGAAGAPSPSLLPGLCVGRPWVAVWFPLGPAARRFSWLCRAPWAPSARVVSSVLLAPSPCGGVGVVVWF